MKMRDETSLIMAKDKQSVIDIGSISLKNAQVGKQVNQLNPPPTKRRLNHDRALRLGI